MPIADEPLVLDLGDQGPKVWLEAMPAIVRETGSAMTPSTHSQRVKTIGTAAISDTVKAVAKQLGQEFQQAELDKVSLGFSLSVDTSGRVLIGASGTFRVQLEWRKANPDPADPQ
jgi:cytochrome oxidase Cu insertion factor (SCO1/SenC/PrrC family)